MRRRGKFKITHSHHDVKEEYEFYYIQHNIDSAYAAGLSVFPEVKFYDCDQNIRDKSLLRIFKKAGGRSYAFTITGNIYDTSKSVEDWQRLIKDQLFSYTYQKKRKKEIFKGDVFGRKSTADIRDEKLEKLIK